MFGIARNKTLAFAIKIASRIGHFTIDFTCGFAEEITCNITNVSPAHGAVLPDQLTQPVNINESLIKSFSVATASALTSTQVRSKAFEIISGATWNLLV
jgi:hypothetical protein